MNSLLALDFDGVICESRPECLVTGLVAYHVLQHQNKKPPLFNVQSLDPQLVDSFMTHRHLVRVAAEFVLLFDLIMEGRPVDDERSLFEQTPADPERMARYKRLFYETRARWVQENPESWYEHNSPFVPVLQTARIWLQAERLAIVSAKDGDSIKAILGRFGLEIDPILILDNSKGDKAELMHILRHNFPGTDIFFVDDNLDNLLLARGSAVTPYLALWGFTSPSSIAHAREQGIEALDLQRFQELFA